MLTLNDGRNELWQWDTGRKITVDAECSQVHFSNKVFGRSIDVDVIDGVATIPDILLQTDKDLSVWAFVGTSENGYTKISKVFKVNKRNKPADYVFTPPDQTTLDELKERLDKIEEAQAPDAVKNAIENYLEQNPVEVPVQSVNGQTGEVKLTAEDVGAISQDDLQEATNEALAQAKASGEFDGEDGKDGTSPVVSVSAIEGGHRITITDTNGTNTVDVLNGTDGQPGKDGADGAPGEKGEKGDTGAQGIQGDKGDKGDKGDTGDAGYTPQKGVDYFDGQPGEPGKDGQDGYTPVKGVDYFDGEDGTSVTHEWDGTILRVTSASGTSSANLKGEKGDKGEPGPQGPTYTLTDTDKNSIAAAVKASLTKENWTFTLEDGSTVTKAVYVG